MKRAVVAGVSGTLVMTGLMLMAPRMGLPAMDIGALLGSVMGGSLLLGWMAHFTIGTEMAGGVRGRARVPVYGEGTARERGSDVHGTPAIGHQ